MRGSGSKKVSLCYLGDGAIAIMLGELAGADAALERFHDAVAARREDLAGLPPIRVDVGSDEVLFDDSRTLVDGAVAAGMYNSNV